MKSTPNAALTFTGERFTPELKGPIWYEHWHRYCVVAALAQGRTVLDAACGEGYGSALLARTAARVIGIDLEAGSIAHARTRYSSPNLEFVRASVTSLPLADASVDLIVSFETIEHLAAQREMLAEFRRVLRHGGALVISSPNRPVYNEAGDVENEYHVRELDRGELKALLDADFPEQAWYAQRVMAHSVLWADGRSTDVVRYDVLGAGDPATRDVPAPPMYFVVVCATAGTPLPVLPALSLFDDGEMSLWKEFARSLARERQLAWDEIDARKVAEDRLEDLVRTVNALASEREKTASLESALVEANRRHDVASAQLAREAAAHGETRTRLAYRETFAGWLRWPLGVARRRLAVRHT